MARYCVHLDETEITVDCDGDETDAIRVARESSGIRDPKHQRCHLLPDEPDETPVDAAPDAAAPKTRRRKAK